MIRNQWYVLLESEEVGKTPIGVTRMGEKMVFWRDSAGKVQCALDKCPHRGVKVSFLLRCFCNPIQLMRLMGISGYGGATRHPLTWKRRPSSIILKNRSIMPPPAIHGRHITRALSKINWMWSIFLLFTVIPLGAEIARWWTGP